MLTSMFPSVHSLVCLCQDLTVKLPVSETGLYPAKTTPATQQESLNTQVPAEVTSLLFQAKSSIVNKPSCEVLLPLLRFLSLLWGCSK